MSDLRIRTAHAGDADGVHDIYAPIVRDTSISFETEPPTVEELAARIEAANRTHLWLTAERDGRVAGYAYGGPHRSRQAYRFSVEVSVYVHPEAQGHRVGARLYQRLFTELAALGYFNAYAGITQPNVASSRLHARMGFEHVGTFPRVGFKFGAWHDVAWWHRPLRDGLPEAR